MVHLFKNNGQKAANNYIAVDINSGAIHLVDEVAYKLIPLVEKLINEGVDDKEKIRTEILAVDTAIEKPLDEILDLYEKKMLFTPDNYEDYVNEVKNRGTVVKALCLHVAHACNLTCRYCFAESVVKRDHPRRKRLASEPPRHPSREGNCFGEPISVIASEATEGGFVKQSSPALMSLETGKCALDFLVANSGNRRNLEVDFFGGEPLLNWEMIKELVAYGRSIERNANSGEKKFRFTLTTNGILINEEMFDFINKEISNVVLSIDGRKEINDRMRPLHDGSGSYDLIIDKFMKLVESRNHKNYYLRGTFTRENLDFAEDVKHLADLGFTQISIEPMVSCGPIAHFEPLVDAGILTDSINEKPQTPDTLSIRPEDIPTICKEYDRLTQEIINRNEKGQAFNFFHFMIDLSGGPCVAKRLTGCGAGSEYLAVTPLGDLYPCHQFVDNPKFLMGNIKTGITNKTIYDNFKAINVYTKPKCRNCFAKFYCSGGCAATAYNTTGDLYDCDDLTCTLQRKRTECAINVKCSS